MEIEVRSVQREEFSSMAAQMDRMGTLDRFSIVDMTDNPEKCSLHVALVGGELEAYLQVYDAGSYGIARLLGEEEAVERLLPHLPSGRMIMMCTAPLQSVVREKFPENPTYLEQLMSVGQDNLRKVDKSGVGRLGPSDAEALHSLYMSGEFATRARLSSVRAFRERLTNEPEFGLWVGGRLASVARAMFGDETFGMVGGVFTDPSHRGKGYGGMVTFAATEHLLQKSRLSMLYVRKDNLPAIRVYQKLGYVKREEWAYFDFGTGIIP